MTPRSAVWHKIRGLYGIADACASGDDPVGLAEQLLAGGCRVIQVRCKRWSRGDIRAAAIEIRRRCHAVDALCLVNDDVSLVDEVGADGVHVGQLDGDAETVRSLLGPDRILGRSTHSTAQIREALTEADYIAFGPIFPTSNLSVQKPARGVDELRSAAHVVDGRTPLVAIGGLLPHHVPELKDAGAQAWAVIGHIASADDPARASRMWAPSS